MRCQYVGPFGDIGVTDSADQLVHRCYTCTASDKCNMVMFVGLPGVLGDRSLEIQSLIRLHIMHMLRHWSVGVLLYDKVDKTRLIFVRNGCVGPDYRLLHLWAFVFRDNSGYIIYSALCEELGKGQVLRTYKLSATRICHPCSVVRNEAF